MTLRKSHHHTRGSLPWLEARWHSLLEPKRSAPALTCHHWSPSSERGGGFVFRRDAEGHPCDLPRERLTPSPGHAPGLLQYRSLRLMQQPPSPLPLANRLQRWKGGAPPCPPQGPSSSKWSLDHEIVGLPDPPESHNPPPHPLASASASAVATALTPDPFTLWWGKRPQDPVFPAGFPETCLPVLHHFQPLTHLLVNYFYPLHKCSAQHSRQTSPSCWQPQDMGGAGSKCAGL